MIELNKVLKIVGTYNSCAVVEIFGIKGKKIFNIFTLFTFEYSIEEKIFKKFLTKKPLKATKDISIGIFIRRLDLDEAKEIYRVLSEENKYKINGEESSVGALNKLRKQYVEKIDSHNRSNFNNIIKNNFYNGSYIFEFFDESKENLDFLLKGAPLLNKISEEISNIIPIKLGTISDRLGNIIFQLPINKFKVNIRGKEKGINIEILDKKINRNEKEKYFLIVRSVFENHILDFKIDELFPSEKLKFIEIDTSNTTEIEIINKDIILYRNSFSFMKNVEMEFNIGGPQKRYFKLKNDVKEIEICSRQTMQTGEKEKYKEWIFNRKYNMQLKELTKSKSFIQYKKNEHNRALNDVIELMNGFGKNGVYLWDPYATAEDIKKTLYNIKYSNVDLKVITSISRENIEKSQAEFNSDNIDYLFLNLEVRNQIGNIGWNFHDRFLIFPLEKPKVWSLGTSINSLGKNHHILQEVSQPQHILNSFNELWNELNREECIVWKI